MTFVDKSQEIKKLLLQGGLVVSQRNTGKTKALYEILLEDPDAVVIVYNNVQKNRLEKWLLEGGFSKEDARKRVINSMTAESQLLGRHKNIYIDEYYENPYKGPFKSTTASFPFPVKVVK